MGRIMALDYGRNKTGVAVTDTLRIAAHGLPTLQTEKVLDFLNQYVSKEDLDLIIVGLPRHPDGNLSSNAPEIDKFAKKIRKLFPEIKVELVDESYTSRDAKELILKSGAGRKKRRDKELVDKVAAVLILQRYLNHI
ncbi:MAG: Holliday junction resolvase RuvX [Saprospirales bacterium]|nr:MAG: Holliday junction resolvase RuvX [Saprospirales bacterium]